MSRRKKARRDPRDEIIWREVLIADVNFSIYAHAPRPNDLWPNTDTTIELSGSFVEATTPVKVLVFCRDGADSAPGSVIGTKPVWQLVVSLPRPGFETLLVLAANRRIKAVMFSAATKLRYGKGPIHGITFRSQLSDENA